MAVQLLVNRFKNQGLPKLDGLTQGEIIEDAAAARALFSLCPSAAATAMDEFTEFAERASIARLWVKREDQRMGLGSFKALGATHAIAKFAAQRAVEAGLEVTIENLRQVVADVTFVCASAGNHGLSMAAGARLFGAKAVVILAETVPEGFAARLEEKQAKVLRAGANYEESLDASIEMAAENGWHLLADGTWDGYFEPARDVLEGYMLMGDEFEDQIHEQPTHIFLQAGVGGLAAAGAATARQIWGDGIKIIVVEPEAAPALIESVRQGECVTTPGPVSSMGRLDCKTPSHIALKYLARQADLFMTIDDERVEKTVAELAAAGIATSPSGGAGIAALMHGRHLPELGLDENSKVVCILSEGAA